MPPVMVGEAEAAAPMFDRAVAALATSDRLLATWNTAEDARVAAVPRPRFPRATDALARSDRLFAVVRTDPARPVRTCARNVPKVSFLSGPPEG